MKIANNFTHSSALSCVVLLAAAVGELNAQVITAVTANNLNFAHHVSSTTLPQPQTVRFFSNPTNLTYLATATTDAAGAWLLVNGATAVTGITGTPSQDFQIGVNPTGLTPNTYTGTVSLTVVGASPQLIRVTLVVSTSPQVSLSPASLVLNGQSGTTTSTTVAVNSTGAVIPYTAAVTFMSPQAPAGWLSVLPTSGSTGSSVTIIANASGFQQSVPVGVVTFTPATPGGAAVTLPVTFNVGAAASLVVNPTSTTIGFQLGTATPSSRQITVNTSTGSQVPYTAQVASGAWLSLSSTPTTLPGSTVLTGTTPNPFYAVANPAGLAAGSYDGRILVSSPNIPGGAQDVMVTLVVSTQPLIQTTPESVTFNHTLGTSVPVGQLVSVTSTSGQQLPFSVTQTTTTGGDWLTVAPSVGTTNQSNLLIGLNATRVGQLTAGTYSGTVTIAAAGVGNSPLAVPVTLNISGSALISVVPNQLNFNLQQGQTTTAQSLTVTSTDPAAANQPFSISVEPSTANFLVISPMIGITPLLVNVNVNPNAITSPGVYDATIVVTPTSVQNAVPQRIPVKVTVIGATTVTANPTRVDFTQPGTTAPQPQTVTLTSTVAGVTFQTAASQPWITVTPPSGTITSGGTPIQIGVTNTGLTPGNTYEGNVTVSVSGVTTLTIPVRFSYQNSATLGVTPSQLTFNFQTGSTAPAAQNIILASNGMPIAFTAAAATTSGGNWLSVSPASGTTAASGGAPTNVAVSVNPSGLAVGTYRGTVTLTAPNASNSPQTVNVTLMVSNPTPPVITSVLNGASNAATSVSPGLIIAIKGSNLGPTTGVGAQVQGGVVTTQIGDVRVLFDNVAAPMLFARQDQVNTIAPYFLANRTSTRMIVEYRGVRSEPIDLRVVETAPGLFTSDSSGNGQGALLNQDNSVNGPSNPATRGSIIVLYATGEGQVIPAGADGQVITSNNLRRPMANVQVRIGGMTAEVLYAGSAPGLVSGALQVNARVPANLQITAPTPVPVELIIGNATSSSTQNVTATIRP